MREIRSENQLLKELQRDIDSTPTKHINILAGHFPLRVNRKTKTIYEDLSAWGDFSTYTLELGCTVGKNAKKLGKKVKFIFLCDDQTYRDSEKKWLADEKDCSEAQLDNRWRTARDQLYKKRSGANSKLPDQYSAILKKYGFSANDVTRHDHGKHNRHDCLYFSEAVLRNPKNITNDKELKNINACSREYISLLEGGQLETDTEAAFLVSFIPNKCSHYVSDAIDFFVRDFIGVHVFMTTENKPTKKNFFERDIHYKRNAGI